MLNHLQSQTMRNERGFSLIELLIVMAISTLVTGAAIYTFTKQDKLLRNEQTSTSLRAMGRNGLNELAKEIRRAGYGMPRGQGLKDVFPDQIKYWANVEDVSTVLSLDMLTNTTTATVVGNASVFQKLNATQHEGYILMRDAQNYNKWHTLRYSSDAGSVLTTMTGADYQPDQDFLSGTTILNKIASFDVDYDTTLKMVTFKRDNEAAVPLVNNVKSFTLDYYQGDGTAVTVTSSGLSNGYYTSTGNLYNSKTIHSIRKVQITMVLRDKDADATDPKEPELTFTTDVNLRNMS